MVKSLQLSIWIINIKYTTSCTLALWRFLQSIAQTHELTTSENSSTQSHLPELYSCQHVRLSPKVQWRQDTSDASYH